MLGMSRWINNCDRLHPQLPARALDLGLPGITNDIKLKIYGEVAEHTSESFR